GGGRRRRLRGNPNGVARRRAVPRRAPPLGRTPNASSWESKWCCSPPGRPKASAPFGGGRRRRLRGNPNGVARRRAVPRRAPPLGEDAEGVFGGIQSHSC